MFAASHKLRAIRRLAVGAAAIGILTSVTVAPAFAALTDDAEISVGVTAGAMEILATEQPTFAPVPFRLGESAQTTSDNFIYSVTDNTGNAELGWTVTVASSGLSSGTNSIGAANITLTSVSVTSTLGEDTTGVTAESPVTPDADGETILSASGEDGDGAYSHNVNVQVSVPDMTPAGTYTGTLVFTVAAETEP